MTAVYHGGHMIQPQVMRRKWLAPVLTLSFILQGLVPAAALATNGGGGNSGGVVPNSKIDVDFEAFRLSGAYSHVNGQPTAAGAWSDADTKPTAVKDYTQGSCVPQIVKVKNTSAKKGDVRFTLVYEYEAGILMGTNNLEKVTVNDPILGADNLNDVVLSGQSLSSATSFKADDASTINSLIKGPFSGFNSGSSPTWVFNGFRHYNVELEDVPPGRTVYVPFCARISKDSDIWIDDYISTSVILGGQLEDISYIKKSSIKRLPTLTLEAQVNQAGAVPSQFSFQVSPSINGVSNFPIPAGKTKVVIKNVPPEAAYTITETGPTGYSFTSGSGTNCSFSGSTATATPAPGTPALNANCVFVNGQSASTPATLKVTKVVVNNNGGTKVVSDFPLFVSGEPVVSGVSATYAPGTYQVTEATSTEYMGTFSGDCNAAGQVTLTSGSVKNCTLTNDDVIAYLSVTKVVVNDNGGTKTTADFPLYVNGNPIVTGQLTAFGPGTYHVSEDADSGYLPTFSGDCDVNGNVTLALGQTKHCVITNNDILPTLKVTKIVVNNDGRTKTIADFPLFVNGVPTVSEQVVGHPIGSYVVSETTDPDYTATFSGDCDEFGNVTLALGDAKECVLTNDDLPIITNPTLTVTKIVVNDHEGTMTVSDFPLFVNGLPVTSGVTSFMAEGSYVVTETNQPGYFGSFSGDCDANGNVTLTFGTAQNCIVTNQDADATLTIQSVVVNDNGGFLTPSDFPLTVDGIAVNAEQPIGLLGGSHQVNVQTNPRYFGVWSGDCNADGVVTLEFGQNKTCTITNYDVSSGLIVFTKVINDNGGTAVPSDFLTFIQAFGAPSGLVPGVGTGLHLELLPGPLSVAQLTMEGYEITFEGDCFGFIEAGNVYSCTITNNDL